MIKYECSNCAIQNVKLWRQYNTFLEHIELLCVNCANEKKVDVKEDGYHWNEDICQRTSILENKKHGSLVPAIPENDTFWGYTSVPQDRIDWWENLPLR